MRRLPMTVLIGEVERKMTQDIAKQKSKDFYNHRQSRLAIGRYWLHGKERHGKIIKNKFTMP